MRLTMLMSRLVLILVSHEIMCTIMSMLAWLFIVCKVQCYERAVIAVMPLGRPALGTGGTSQHGRPPA